jgi:hypothetical protein
MAVFPAPINPTRTIVLFTTFAIPAINKECSDEKKAFLQKGWFHKGFMAKSKLKRLVTVLVILAVAGTIGYLSLVDVTPSPEQVIKEIDNSRFDQQH